MFSHVIESPEKLNKREIATILCQSFWILDIVKLVHWTLICLSILTISVSDLTVHLFQRRILAKELGDFIHIYGKETQQLAQKARMRKLLLQSKDDTDVGMKTCLILSVS